jgi:NAD(P)-dependent dehydrogenase (short-subunit alcohol dehydrogenase family)
MKQPHRPTVGLVTGATAGIGLACATALIRTGFTKIVITGRSRERGVAAIEALRRSAPGTDVHFLSADVSTADGALASATACVDRFGRIDALVSCAGGSPVPRLMLKRPSKTSAGLSVQ